MSIDISNLRIELRTGSFASVYSANILTGNYNGLADTINTPQGIGSSIVVGTLATRDLQQMVIGSEFLSLTQAQRDLWNVMMTAGQGGLAISLAAIRGQVAQVWSAGTSTRSNFSAAQTRLASRGEALFGEGTTVDVGSIYVALTQP